MFTFPPYPPKDYALRHVPKIQRSSLVFTPDSQPRVTQTTLGIFCSPIEYKEGESPEKVQIQTYSPKVAEKWARAARAFWVDKPGKDDFFIHHMHQKYSVKFDSYNPSERHMEKVFNRSYQYELACLEERRLQKLRDKCQKEQTTSDEHDPIDNGSTTMKIVQCKSQPPFWWKRADAETSTDNQTKHETLEATSKPPPGRWTKEPCLTAVTINDPCKMKYDMELVGQPFRTEACNFYYTNYPQPDIKFRPKKFI